MPLLSYRNSPLDFQGGGMGWGEENHGTMQVEPKNEFREPAGGDPWCSQNLDLSSNIQFC